VSHQVCTYFTWEPARLHVGARAATSARCCPPRRCIESRPTSHHPVLAPE
jgi:hypothetical protein